MYDFLKTYVDVEPPTHIALRDVSRIYFEIGLASSARRGEPPRRAVCCVAIAVRNRGTIPVRGKSMVSTCIRDTAPCRTDEPLGRLTFFHAAACPFDYEHRPVRVPLFLSLAPRTSREPSLSHPPPFVPFALPSTFPFSRSRSFSPLGRQSPLHWRRATVLLHPLSLRVYHSFPQQCRRRAEPILCRGLFSAGVSYYPRVRLRTNERNGPSTT